MPGASKESRDARMGAGTRLGAVFFAGGRLASPFLQHWLFASGAGARLLARLGLSGASSVVLRSSSGLLGLSSLPTLVVAASSIAVLRHLIWISGGASASSTVPRLVPRRG